MMSFILKNVIYNLIISENSQKSVSNNSDGLKFFLSRKKRKINRYLMYSKIRKTSMRKIPKLQQYVKFTEKYPDDIFKSHLKMERSTFLELQKKLEPHWKHWRFGRISYSLKQCLYVTIWRLINRTKFRILSDRFGVAIGTAYNIFIKTIKVICVALKNEIKWPNSRTENLKIIEDFQQLRTRHFPFVVGCVDGTHIRIPTPKVDPSSYYNRKGYHSIILQGICDSNFLFLDIFFGYPGSCHDANVWRNSPICKALESGSLRLPEGCHLLGDSAYPLTSNLIVPYKNYGTLTAEQIRFNVTHSCTRVCIEQTFGILKRKFEILEYLNFRRVSTMKFVVFSCVLLHNFIIRKEKISDVDPTEFIFDDEMPDVEIERHPNEQGVQKREYLTNLLAS